MSNLAADDQNTEMNKEIMTSVVHVDTGVAKAEMTLLERAQAANAADHDLTFWQAARKYKMAMFWACIFSFTLTMEATDLSTIPAYFGQDQFKQQFGSTVNGVLEIPAEWQTALQQSGSAGEIIGLAIVGFLADRIGWKLTLTGMMVFLTGFLFLFAFPKNLGMIVAGNIICGIPYGAFQSGCIAYGCEMVPSCLRGFVTAWVGICWGLGFFTGSWIVRVFLNLPGEWSWRIPFLIQFVWPVPLIICYLMAPESPYYCVRKGKLEEAKKVLRRIRNMKNITEEEIEQEIALIDYTNKVEGALNKSGTYIECFTGKDRWRTEIVCMVAMCTNWGGNAINSQTVQFLEQAGLSEVGAFDLNLVLNAQYLTFGLLCIWLMTKFGRATIFITGMIITDIFLICIGALGCVKQTTAVSNAIGALLVVGTVVYIFTVAPCSYTIIGEVPSSNLRAKTVVLSRIVFNASGIIINVLLPLMLTGGAWNLGAKTAFMFVASNTLLWIWCLFRLPETKDRTFYEIDWLFNESGLSARKWRKAKINAFDAGHEGTVAQHEKIDAEHIE
ncbi:hypothetical protein SEUCBS139899_008843 [Sporothrix eucalyptigena]